MNIFRLDEDFRKCAEYHTDRHLVKMIVEHMQLMSTAHHVAGSSLDVSSVYKKTHHNHPCGVWVRESKANYLWLHRLTVAMCKEYSFRYGKVHKAIRSGMLRRLARYPKLPDIGPTPQRLAMPERYHVSNPVVAYRNYYVNDKSHLFTWRGRPMPSWLVQFGFQQTE
jgi:hypothetical protein